MCATLGGALGGENLGDHAAFAEGRPGTAGHRFERRVAGNGVADKSGGRILARISGVESHLICKDHQHIRFDQIRNQCP